MKRLRVRKILFNPFLLIILFDFYFRRFFFFFQFFIFQLYRYVCTYPRSHNYLLYHLGYGTKSFFHSTISVQMCVFSIISIRQRLYRRRTTPVMLIAYIFAANTSRDLNSSRGLLIAYTSAVNTIYPFGILFIRGKHLTETVFFSILFVSEKCS